MEVNQLGTDCDKVDDDENGTVTDLTIRNMENEQLRAYKRKKHQERKTNFKDQTMFEAINMKYKYRESRLKSLTNECEIERTKDKNEDDQLQELYNFFQ